MKPITHQQLKLLDVAEVIHLDPANRVIILWLFVAFDTTLKITWSG
jgi:hypothetical protein